MRELPRRLTWPLLLLLLVAAVALAVRIHFARPDTFPSVDGVFYLEQSRALVLHHRLPFSSFSPGWPLLAALPLFFGDATDALQVFRAAQGTNVVLGALWPVLTFFLLRRYLGRWTALLGAAILAALPLAIVAAKGDLSETSYGCLLVAAFLLLPRRRLLAGLALGYAYLIRPEALLVVLGVAIWQGCCDRRLPWRTVTGAALCLVPYVLFVHQNTGEWALTGKMVFWESAQERHAGGAFLALVGRNLGTFLPLLPGLLGVPMVLLAGLGIWRRPRHPYLALLALLPLPLFDFAMVARYWLPYVPFLLLAAGEGAQETLARVRFLPRKATEVFLVVAALGGLCLVAGDDAHWVSRNVNRYEGPRAAGLWLRSRVAANTKIAAYKPFASFWAGCGFVKYPPCRDVRHLLDQLETQGVDYLVVNAHVAQTFVPELQALLSQHVAPDLKLRVTPLEIFDGMLDDQFTVVFRLVTRETGIR